MFFGELPCSTLAHIACSGTTSSCQRFTRGIPAQLFPGPHVCSPKPLRPHYSANMPAPAAWLHTLIFISSCLCYAEPSVRGEHSWQDMSWHTFMKHSHKCHSTSNGPPPWTVLTVCVGPSDQAGSVYSGDPLTLVLLEVLIHSCWFCKPCASPCVGSAGATDPLTLVQHVLLWHPCWFCRHSWSSLVWSSKSSAEQLMMIL